MKTYQSYLFDADGTLFDTAELICDCFQHVAIQHTDKALDRSAILSGYGLPLKGQLLKLLGTDIDIERVLDDYMDYQLEVLEERIVPFPGVVKTLEKIKNAGKQLAIVTSRRRYSMEKILDYTGTTHLFDTVVTPEDTHLHKPDAAPTLLAIEQLGAEKAGCVFTGDAEFDILSGSGAGIDTAFVGWSHLDVASLSVQPTWTLTSINDIAAPLP
ncbi:HAD family hydrolase [Desulfopila sp. IMCC35008]|uniref:HAD family hydrolase n=1 Tax=Desulfopila sp. IMCC35008 TaxID=2653858 RepID=UPI0013D27FA7|nr:HAD family hydrolase [Desulfopila sp. IMCC35008]